MKIMEGFVVKIIAGNTVIIPIGQKLMEGNQPIQMFDECEFLVRNLYNDISKENLSEIYAKKYNVSKSESDTEIEDFIEIGRKYGFLQE